MAGSSLLALIDDIATLLDDVAVMTKAATKQTAGVLGDDLALNAQQVAGVDADRELPVVWAVAKGSLINKTILVPAALVIVAIEGWLRSQGWNVPLVLPLMMIGGAYLCFEGVEKLAHKFLHSEAEDHAHHVEMVEAIKDEHVDMVAFERDKIKGAIRTDFILSAEIIVISLGTIDPAATFLTKLGVLVGISLIMTAGVYGLVGGIVKLDDAGLYLSGRGGKASRAFGRMLLRGAPFLMKFLSIAGTAAMFLVGGNIVVHGIEPLHHLVEHWADASGGGVAGGMVAMGVEGVLGILTGIVVLLAVKAVTPLVRMVRKAPAKA